MKHYHGTPIGRTRESAEKFVEGRFVLVPWKRPEDLQRAMSFSRGFCVDNSAYTFWTSGEKPDWSEYIKWVRTFAQHPRFEFALIPDVIDGTETDNDDLIKQWSKSAYHPVRIAGAPVWHLHESLGRLERLVSGRWQIVALGSSGQWPNPGVGCWWDRMNEAFGVICGKDGYPKCKIHGLRMLRGDIVSRYPFASCDSTNAVQNGGREAEKNGVDAGWGSLTIARRMELIQSPSKWEPQKTQQRFELIA